MDSVLNTVAGYFSTLVVERWPEVIGMLAMLAFWRWFTWHKVRKIIAALKIDADKRLTALEAKPSESTQVILQPGATYIDCRGASGEWHLKADGQVEVISARRIPVQTLGITAPAMEAIATVNKRTPRSDESDDR